MRAYFSVFRLRHRLETQYRGAVMGGIACQIFFGLILISVYRALYFGSPQDMPLSHITTYVWLQQAFFRMLLSSDEDLMEKIRTGGIACDLCRPMNLYGFYYARIMAQKLTGSLLRGAPMILFAACLPKGWGLSLPFSPSSLVLSAAALFLGLLCVCAMENITMGFTMRLLDRRGVQAMLNMLMMILSGSVLPLTLYPDSAQKAISLLPYAQLLDAPIRLYTGDYIGQRVYRVLLLQGAWVLVLILAGCLLWRKNLRRLVIQGG